MSKIEVDAIDKQSGSTLTLGGSGTAVTLACGATQTGFGRTGTVDWQTTKKTTSFTAVNGEGYFVDTGGGVVTVTLPASPSAGNIVYIKDYDGNFGSNKCTIARNGSNIRGATDNIDLEKNNAGVVCIYVDATEGWQLFFDGSDADAQATFLEATGGTVSCAGNFKIHKFTGPGSFDVNQLASSPGNNVVDYLVVAGGGAGLNGNAGGGGAGGYRESHNPTTSGCYTASPLAAPNSPSSASIPVTLTSFPVTVGAGGAGIAPPGPSAQPANPGSNSTFSSITSAGGGSGGSYINDTPASRSGSPGGSGGGGSISTTSNPGSASGGSGNTPPVAPAQGTDGGTGHYTPSANSGGGGGGATEAGQNSTAPSGPGNTAGRGGAGTTSEISGASTAYAGGGGGGAGASCKGGATSPCGTGGFGGGNAPTPTPAPSRGAPQPLQPTLPTAPANTTSSGVTNTGGGGGASNGTQSGSGGSGIVIIRYRAR